MRESILRILYDIRDQISYGITKYEVEVELKKRRESLEENIKADLKYLVEKKLIRQKKYRGAPDDVALYEITSEGIDVIETGNWYHHSLKIDGDVIVGVICGDAKGVVIGKEINSNMLNLFKEVKENNNLTPQDKRQHILSLINQGIDMEAIIASELDDNK